MIEKLPISEKIHKLSEKIEKEIAPVFKNIEKIEWENTQKVLASFRKYQVSEVHFHETSGYGYNDLGRDTVEKIFADILGCEDALVRGQFISGSHALNVTLFALLRPGDLLLSITGKPYDTLDEVIGIKDNPSSLKSFGILYDQIDLVNNQFDTEKIITYLKNHQVKVIEIQRSKGYSTRKSLTVSQVSEIIKEIRKVDKEVIIMVDNCYCEMVSSTEPHADILVGSLIKNLGGGIAPNGAYVAGRSDLIHLVAQRLTLPGEGREVGPSLGMNKLFLQGLYLAPSVVASSLKTAVFASKLLEELGYLVEPLFNEERADIVENIIFNDKGKLIRFCQGIQAGSAIDSYVVPEPYAMPGYSDEVIMASGSFTQGSSIELSADGPLRSPYIAYLQGGLTYAYGKLGVMIAATNLENEK